MSYAVLMPVLDDWDAARRVIEHVDREFAAAGSRVSVLLVDDGSSTPPPLDLCPAGAAALLSLELLVLRRNLGHQRAIAIGLAHLESRGGSEAVVVMDADGEDSPADAVRLLQALAADGARRIVFAERTRRSEGLGFRAGWLGFRALHRVLAGHRIRFGNFSAIPAAQLRRVVAVSELWNHYVAAVLVAKLPYFTLPTARSKRFVGESRMGLVGLVVHAVRALSVFGETIGVRLLLVTLVLALGWIAGAAVVIGSARLHGVPVPVWTGALFGLSGALLAQIGSLGVVFLFLTVGSRSNVGFIPSRDFQHFVLELRRLGP